jgi:hypothetical protein
MTEPRSGDAAPESQPFSLPPFTPPAPSPAPWPLNAAPPPFSAPQQPARSFADETFAPEPPPLPQESTAPELELVNEDDELMPWETAWMTSDAVAEVTELAAPTWAEPLDPEGPTAPESSQPEWLSIEGEEEEPVALAELAPAEPEPEADEVPAWLSWMDEDQSDAGAEEIGGTSEEIGLVEVGDLGAPLEASSAEPWVLPGDDEAMPWAAAADSPAAESLSWGVEDEEAPAGVEEVVEVVEEPVAWMEPMEPEDAAPAIWAEPAGSPAAPFTALAERLERMAAELRNGDPAALLATAGRDPLEVLILGYALGQMHAAREGERG